jgi:hypothetical protein
MTIEIDTDALIDNQLSAEELFILILLSKKAYHYIDKYSSLYNLENIIKNLAIKGFVDTIINSNVIQNTILTNKSKLLLEGTDLFDEFYNTYPVSAIRADGNKDYLRTNLPQCRLLYFRIINKSKSKHKNIINCLKEEIKYRTKTGSMSYMKRMYNWLKSEEWKVYEQKMIDDNITNNTVNGNEKYGESIL